MLIHNLQKLIRRKNIIFIWINEEESKFVDFKARGKLDLTKVLQILFQSCNLRFKRYTNLFMKIAKSSFCYVRVLKIIWLLSSKNVNFRFMIFTNTSLRFYQIWKIENTSKILKLFIFSDVCSFVNVKIFGSNEIFISFTSFA